MFSALASFAQIHAQDIPQGVMPNKRQVVGTGVTSSTTSAPPTTTDETTSEDSTTPETTAPTTTPETTEEPETTTAPTTEPTSTDAEPTTSANTDDDTTTTAPTSSPTSDQPEETTTAGPSTSDDADTTSEEETGTSEPPSSTPTSQTAVTTTDSEGSTITSSVPLSSAPRATSAVQTITDEDEDPLLVIGSSTIDPSTYESATTITSNIVRESTEPFTTTSYFTEDGTLRSRVLTSDRVVSSTEVATATIDPTLAKGGNGGGSSPMSSQTKAIIGGVVGGIGGAILIGGIAIVAWRLWAKKKRDEAAAVDDFGMGTAGSPRDSLGREKQTSSSSHAPTLSTDSYRNPNGAVNTASNF